MRRLLRVQHKPTLVALAVMVLQGLVSAPAFALLYSVNTTSDSGHDPAPGN